MTHARKLLTLEVEPGTDPIQGLVREDDGAAREFVGWLGLAAALEAVIAPAPAATSSREPAAATEGLAP